MSSIPFSDKFAPRCAQIGTIGYIDNNLYGFTIKTHEVIFNPIVINTNIKNNK